MAASGYRTIYLPLRVVEEMVKPKSVDRFKAIVDGDGATGEAL